MREIKFRGKRVDNGEWAYGVPQVTEISGVYIVWSKLVASQRRDGSMSVYDKVEQSEVIPDTVGQYTGLKDKNGVEIFEGDIVRHSTFGIKEVVWGNKSEICLSFTCGFMYDRTIAYVHANESAEVELIGNIHDNPELLEVTE